jgi:pimeloyl-ACP methyl ester carboxylesterase
MKSLRGLIEHDMVPLYKDIEAPTLVIWGENDMIVPAENAEIAANAIPDVKKVVMPECGHVPMIEKPDEFNRLSLEFLG